MHVNSFIVVLTAGYYYVQKDKIAVCSVRMVIHLVHQNNKAIVVIVSNRGGAPASVGALFVTGR